MKNAIRRKKGLENELRRNYILGIAARTSSRAVMLDRLNGAVDKERGKRGLLSRVCCGYCIYVI